MASSWLIDLILIVTLMTRSTRCQLSALVGDTSGSIFLYNYGNQSFDQVINVTNFTGPVQSVEKLNTLELVAVSSRSEISIFSLVGGGSGTNYTLVKSNPNAHNGKPISQVAVVADDKFITVGDDVQARVWKWDSSLMGSGLTLVLNYSSHLDSINDVCVLSGKTIAGPFLAATGSTDQTVKIWDWATGQTVTNISVGYQVNSIVQVSYALIASGDTNREIHLWSIQSGSHFSSLIGHTGAINSMVMMSMGFLIAGDTNGTIKIWNWMNTYAMTSVQAYTSSPVDQLDVTWNLYVLSVSSGQNQTAVKVWKLITNYQLTPMNVSNSYWNPNSISAAAKFSDEFILPFGILVNDQMATFYPSCQYNKTINLGFNYTFNNKIYSSVRAFPCTADIAMGSSDLESVFIYNIIPNTFDTSGTFYYRRPTDPGALRILTKQIQWATGTSSNVTNAYLFSWSEMGFNSMSSSFQFAIATMSSLETYFLFYYPLLESYGSDLGLCSINYGPYFTQMFNFSCSETGSSWNQPGSFIYRVDQALNATNPVSNDTSDVVLSATSGNIYTFSLSTGMIQSVINVGLNVIVKSLVALSSTKYAACTDSEKVFFIQTAPNAQIYAIANTTHTDTINKIALVASNSMMITISNDKTCQVIDLSNMQSVRTFTSHTSSVMDIVVLSTKISSNLIATGGLDSKIYVWLWSNGSIYTSLTNSAPINALTQIKDTVLASGDTNGVIKMWSLTNSTSFASLLGHTASITTMSTYINIDTILISADATGIINVWECTNYTNLYNYISHAGLINRIDITDNSYLLTVSQTDKLFSFYQISSSHQLISINNFSLSSTRPMSVAALNPYINVFIKNVDPSLTAAGPIVVGGQNGSLMIYNAGSLQKVVSNTGASRSITSIATIDANRFATASSDMIISIFDSSTFDLVDSYSTSHSDAINVLVYSSTDNTLITASSDSRVVAWNMPGYSTVSLSAVYTFANHTSSVGSLITLNGQLAASSAYQENRVVVWYKSNRSALTIISTTSGVSSIAQVDYYTIATGQANKILFYNVYSGAYTGVTLQNQNSQDQVTWIKAYNKQIVIVGYSKGDVCSWNSSVSSNVPLDRVVVSSGAVSGIDLTNNSVWVSVSSADYASSYYNFSTNGRFNSLANLTITQQSPASVMSIYQYTQTFVATTTTSTTSTSTTTTTTPVTTNPANTTSAANVTDLATTTTQGVTTTAGSNATTTTQGATTTAGSNATTTTQGATTTAGSNATTTTAQAVTTTAASNATTSPGSANQTTAMDTQPIVEAIESGTLSDEQILKLLSDFSVDVSGIGTSSINEQIQKAILSSGIDTNDCLVNCSNQGVCTLGLDKLVCSCNSQYFGSNCQYNKDPCSYSPCLNGGTCQSSVDSFEFNCTCPSGYYGDLCENKVNVCANETCSGNGACSNLKTYAECKCFTFYSGGRCETESNQKKVVETVVDTAMILSLIVISSLYAIVAFLDLWKLAIYLKGDAHLMKGKDSKKP